MKLRQLRVLHLFLFVLTTQAFASGCGEVQPLNFSMKEDKSWEQLLEDGRNAKNAGKIDQAESSFQAAVDACEKKFGEDDGRTGTCVAELAQLYRNQQEWLKARKAYRQWLKIMDKNDPTGEQIKIIREGYQEIKGKIKKYDLDPDKKKEKPKDESAEEGKGEKAGKKDSKN